MRIGFVIYDSLDSLSGGYLYDREFIAHLRRAGDQVEMICLSRRGYLRQLGDNLQLARWLAAMPPGRFDLIIQDELTHPSFSLANRRLSSLTGVPTISLVHHLRSSESLPPLAKVLSRSVEARYLNSVDGFIFNSAATRQSVAALCGRSTPGVIALPGRDHIHSAITRPEIVKRARQRGPLRLVFVGNLIPRKGLHTLLQAMAEIRASDCSLSIIGDPSADPPYTARMQRLIRERRLTGRVALLGRLPGRDLAACLAESQVMVVPSAYEGFGIAYLEGMAFGLPALGSSAGGAGALIRDGENGYLIPPGDVKRLAARLSRLSQDRRHLEDLGLAALHDFQRHPTWASSASRARGFLEAMISSPSSIGTGTRNHQGGEDEPLDNPDHHHDHRTGHRFDPSHRAQPAPAVDLGPFHP
jgi:glycosyltransferase involved in cell wall biosynthesis